MKNWQGHLQSRKGLTLLELIIGILLLQILLISAYDLYRLSLSTWDLSINKISQRASERRAMASLAQDLWGASSDSIQATRDGFCLQNSVRICYRVRKNALVRSSPKEEKSILQNVQGEEIQLISSDSTVSLVRITLQQGGDTLTFALHPRN